MTTKLLDRNALKQIIEKYGIVESLLLRLSKLENTVESDDLSNDDSIITLKQTASHLKLLDEVMESIGAVEVQIDQLEIRINSVEKLINLT
ncbi:MAG: hypothetical protein ACTSUO_08765 [Candidatus Thorarchaeota archaeon]